MCEESGRTGYALEPLERRWGMVRAAVALGLVWGVFHLVGTRRRSCAGVRPVRFAGGPDPPRAPMTCAACGTTDPADARFGFDRGSTLAAATDAEGARELLTRHVDLASGVGDRAAASNPRPADEAASAALPA